MPRQLHLTGFTAVVAVLAGCTQRPAAKHALDSAAKVQVAAAPIEANGNQQPNRPDRIAVAHLENAYRIHPKVISGGEPKGQQAFASLSRLGVRTIISVDGAKPDLAMAGKHGMRYVHLPHSYDGIPENRARELAKAVRDLEGPVYIHCHHGKHRSPAAAAVACVGAGLIGAGEAMAILTTAGTSTNYRGLYRSAEQARRLDDSLLTTLVVEFRETVEIPPLADAMVALERTHDHVKQIAAAGWRPVAENPDLDPAHEALLLREHYTELMRTEEFERRTPEFQRLMRSGERVAKTLEEALVGIQDRQYPAVKLDSHTSADAALVAINKNCAACHEKFRDVPLDEK